MNKTVITTLVGISFVGLLITVVVMLLNTLTTRPDRISNLPSSVPTTNVASSLSKWNYFESTDQMTSTPIKYAMLTSSNSLTLKFPYSGTNYGKLYIRQSTKYGTDAFFTLENGIVLCSYRKCTVIVRFDDNTPIEFSMLPSEDNGPNVLFFNNASSFIEHAKKSKQILIQVTMHRDGDQVLTFNTPIPLVWEQ